MSNPRIIKQRFQVDFDFDLIFTSKIFDLNNQILIQLLRKNSLTKSKVLVVVDKGVIKAHPKLKESILEYFNQNNSNIEICEDIIELPGGEQSKNDENYIRNLLQSVNEYGIDRHSFLIAIGGGAVLDAVGFAAAIAHRGIRLIRIPTTVLSQNDSGIGVKNGINFFGKKNFIGSFAIPTAVINDDSFLATLSDGEWRSGISEAIKVALIKDYKFFEWIEQHISQLINRNKPVMNDLIYRCAELHMHHIRTSGDPFEQGSSRPLDFGHWSAHKLEQISLYKIRHGEAVAIGIGLDSTYSYLKGLISEKKLKRILNCLVHLGFDILPKELNNQLITGLEEFREHLGGQLTIMLLKDLGIGVEVHEIDTQLVLESMDYMKRFIGHKVII